MAAAAVRRAVHGACPSADGAAVRLQSPSKRRTCRAHLARYHNHASDSIHQEVAKAKAEAAAQATVEELVFTILQSKH